MLSLLNPCLCTCQVPGCASVIAEASGAVANLKIKDGDIIQYVYMQHRFSIDNIDSLL